MATQLAECLGVKSDSLTAMVRKLADMKLVTYKPYQSLTLTKSGQKIAFEVIRQHRLLELYLSEVMGIPRDKVHGEAKKLEHALNEELEDRIDELLGHATTASHGAPILLKACKVNSNYSHKISELKPGEKVKIAETSDVDAGFLRYVGELGLFPGESIEIVDVAPYKGPLILKLHESEIVIGCETAEQIMVNKIIA